MDSYSYGHISAFKPTISNNTVHVYKDLWLWWLGDTKLTNSRITDDSTKDDLEVLDRHKSRLIKHHSVQLEDSGLPGQDGVPVRNEADSLLFRSRRALFRQHRDDLAEGHQGLVDAGALLGEKHYNDKCPHQLN